MGKSHSGFKVGTAVLYRGEIRRPMEILKTKQKRNISKTGCRRQQGGRRCTAWVHGHIPRPWIDGKRPFGEAVGFWGAITQNDPPTTTKGAGLFPTTGTCGSMGLFSASPPRSSHHETATPKQWGFSGRGGGQGLKKPPQINL